MKNTTATKLNLLKRVSILFGLLTQILFSTPHLTEEMKSSIKLLLNYEEIAETLENDIEKAEFYSDVAFEIMNKTTQLKADYANKILNYKIQIEEICNTNKIENVSLDIPDSINLNYEFKMVQVSENSIKKQIHYKQAKVLKNQFINSYKQYLEIESKYKNRIQELEEQILKTSENLVQIIPQKENQIDKSVRDLPIIFKKYLWPSNSGKYITGVFGETRERRFHSGIDVRTFGEIGFEVYAIENGYLERIRTSSKGYGKALYIRLEDGNIAVYAHLNSFKQSFNQIAKYLQNSQNSYTIDHYFEPYEYPVKKGEVIAYTGDTGGISGPHLHFEIRDGSNNPINPFLSNLTIEDAKLPIPNSVAIIPIEKYSLINGFHSTQIVELNKINNDFYQIADTISALGKFGFAIQINDKIDKHPFNFGLYGLNLFIDDSLIYSTQFDIFNFDENSTFYEHRDYTLSREEKGKFYRLFSSSDNAMSFIDESSQPIPKLSNGYHNYTIEAWDFARNLVSINGVVLVDELPRISASLDLESDRLKITFESDESTKPNITLLTSFIDDHTIHPTIRKLENNVYTFENSNHLYKIAEIVGVSSAGIKSKPQYFSISENQVISPVITPKLKHYEHGIIIEFTEEIFSNRTADLLLGNFEILQKFPLERTDKNLFSSQIFSPEELSEFTEFSIKYTGEPELVYKSQLNSQLFIPNRSFAFSFDSDKITVSGDGNTFSDTTLVWINTIESPTLPEGKLISRPYFIGPDLIPYTDKIDITFDVTGMINLDENAGVFYLDKRKDKWYYLKTNKLDNLYSTTALSGEIFAVISENTPPELIDLIPDIGGTYRNLSSLSFFVKDSFSGIDGENNINIEVDGQKIIHEYIPYRSLVSFEFDNNLSKGTHHLSIQVTDNVGNLTKLSGEFYIK